ncbi:MAG: peptide deformylase [Hyphomicrobiales bacterium]|nr:peptide deformylase [Hyphomicrobiales bacterium]
MAVLPLVIYPDPRLLEPSKPVEAVTDETRAFMDDMMETMYASQGIGLAAIQVGVHQRILVMDIGFASGRYKESGGGSKPMYLVNPEIIEESEDICVFDEGCLSFPGQYAEVERPEYVKVRYLDYHGKEQFMEAHGLLARCVQHELDHLDGKVFVDYLSRTKRDLITRRLKKRAK